MADSFTRRTHIVRVPQDKKDLENNYVDVEVLDALAFKGPMGEELVLNFKKGNISVWRDDNTGGGNEKHQATPTRRSHMERKKHGTNVLDVEVLDAISFRGKMGEEYILNLPSKKSSKFSTNDQSDGGLNTRRTHREKISEGFKANPTEYVKVIRTDQVAFRTIMGKEMIIKMPSGDDPNGGEPGRASTYISSPKGYDPTNDDGPKPPLNTDPNIYVSWPKDTGGPWVGDDRISQGMLWWIRKIKSGGGIVYLVFEYTATGGNTPGPLEPRPEIKLLPYDTGLTFNMWNGIYKQIDPDGPAIPVANPITPAMFSGLYHWSPAQPYRKKVGVGGTENEITLYFAWPDGVGSLPTADNYANSVAPYPGEFSQYATQFTWLYGINPPLGFPAWRPISSNLDEQSAEVAQINTFLANSSGLTLLPGFINFYHADGTPGSEPSAAIKGSTYSVQSVTVTDFGGPGTSTVTGRAVAAFNIGALKKFADKGKDTFTFVVSVPESRDAKWTLMGSAYKTDKDFPLSAKNEPQFGFGDDVVDKPRGTKRTDIEVTVNFKDFFVTFEIIGGGGLIGGG